jgi:hypothetical protein
MELSVESLAISLSFRLRRSLLALIEVGGIELRLAQICVDVEGGQCGAHDH